MAYEYANYVSRLQILVSDPKVKAGADAIAQSIDRAVEVFDNDKPYFGLIGIDADGSKEDFNIMTDIVEAWKLGVSYIKSIEYPVNQNPREYLYEGDDWNFIDDGTALDGTNLILRFEAAPTETFLVHYRVQRSIGEGIQQNFAHNSFDFNAITTLAAHYYCMMLAVSYATQIDTRITADSVNTVDICRKYQDLATKFREDYNSLVFGEPTPNKTIQGSCRIVTIKVPTSTGGSQLFH